MSADDRRRQLVGIGVDLLITRPLEELTVQRVAERAEVSRGLVFHYFPTVRDLHLACLEVSAGLLLKYVDLATAGMPHGHERFRAGLVAFVNYITVQPDTFLQMGGYAATDADFGRIFEGIRRQIIERLVENFNMELDRMGLALLTGWTFFVEGTVIDWIRSSQVGDATFPHTWDSLVDGQHPDPDLVIDVRAEQGPAGVNWDGATFMTMDPPPIEVMAEVMEDVLDRWVAYQKVSGSSPIRPAPERAAVQP